MHSIHTAAVSIDDVSILLAGESGAGKTSLLLRLAAGQRGSALADDRVFLDAKTKSAEGYLPGVCVTGQGPSSSLVLQLIPPIRYFVSAKDLPRRSYGSFVPDCLVVLRRMRAQTTIRRLQGIEALRSLTELALAPPQRDLLEFSTDEIRDRLYAIDQCCGSMPIYELSFADLDEAADIVFELARSKLSLGDSAPRGTNLIDDSVPQQTDVVSRTATAKITVVVMGFPIELYASKDVLDKARVEFPEAISGISPAIYRIYFSDEPELLDTDLNMIWNSPQLELSLWENKTSQTFAFGTGESVQHLKNESTSVVFSESRDPEAVYPLFRAAITYVGRLLAGREGWVPMHAGLMLSPSGTGLLVVGPKGSGKTLTCLWLKEAGYELFTDELAAVSRRESGFHAIGLGRDTTVRPDAVSLFGGSPPETFYPFSGSRKASVGGPLAQSHNKWIPIDRIVRPNTWRGSTCSLERMDQVTTQKELYRASAEDHWEKTHRTRQRITFGMANVVEADLVHLSKDLGESSRFVRNLDLR